MLMVAPMAMVMERRIWHKIFHRIQDMDFAFLKPTEYETGVGRSFIPFI